MQDLNQEWHKVYKNLEKQHQILRTLHFYWSSNHIFYYCLSIREKKKKKQALSRSFTWTENSKTIKSEKSQCKN